MMNKSFKYYAIVWAILLAMFNVVVFAAVSEFGDIADLEASFWIGYVSITIAFLGQLGVGYSAFQAKNLQKTFNNVSLVSICWGGLVTMTIVGTICMAIEDFPKWLAIIVCFVVLGFSAISITKATAAASIVGQIDEKIKVKTFFIKSLTMDAETLMTFAKNDAVKAECKKVYEAVRYSDPMSNDALAGVESQITIKFEALSKAVAADDAVATASAAEDVLILLKDRNNRCKLLK